MAILPKLCFMRQKGQYHDCLQYVINPSFWLGKRVITSSLQLKHVLTENQTKAKKIPRPRSAHGSDLFLATHVEGENWKGK